jgi:hypothetical protein
MRELIAKILSYFRLPYKFDGIRITLQEKQENIPEGNSRHDLKNFDT